MEIKARPRHEAMSKLSPEHLKSKRCSAEMKTPQIEDQQSRVRIEKFPAEMGKMSNPAHWDHRSQRC